MWVRRAFVNDLIEIKEPRGRDSFLAEGFKAIEGRVGEKPCRANGYCSWGGGDFAGRILFEGFVELGGGDQVRGESAGGCHVEGSM